MSLMHDLMFAWRNALKRPGTSLLIVVTLALGIGANTAMFSVAWHVLLAPLPYADGERLVRLVQHEQIAGAGIRPWSPLTIADVQQQSSALEAVISYEQNSLTLLGSGLPRQVNAGEVSWNYFDVLGIRPLLGRSFQADEDEPGARPLMLLSYELWLNSFGGDPEVIGSTVELNGLVLTITGVLPQLPPYPHQNDVWITPAGNPYTVKLNSASNVTRRSLGFSYVFGVLRTDFTLEEAGREVASIAQRLQDAYPDDYSADYVIELRPVRDEMVGESATTIGLLLTLAVLVVLIASANVANLNLARTSARAQELAIREAVGASPARIGRQLLTESLLLALVGGLLGLCLAWSCVFLLAEFAAQYTPLASAIRIDTSVLVFALAIAGLTGVLSGTAAVFTRRDINRSLKEGGDKTTTSSEGAGKRRLLLAIQFALSFMLLTTSMLIMLSLYRLNAQDTGYDAEQVLAVSLPVNVDLDSDPQQFTGQIRSFGNSLLEAVQAMPGVGAAGFLGGRPLLQSSFYNPPLETFLIDGRGSANPDADVQGTFSTASEDLFSLMDIPLLRGRLFNASDDQDAVLVALVNENFASRYFPGEEVLGRGVKFPWADDWRTIVGVTGNIRARGLNEEEGAAVYYHFQQQPSDVMNLYVKSTMVPQELGSVITEIVRQIKPDQSIASMQPLDDIKSDWLAPTRLRATLIALFGLLALVVTLSGVIGVVSYNVSQRVREIGIHMAVGATPAQVTGLFIADGMRVYLVGLLLGIVLMLAGAPLLRPLLYQTAAMDPGVYLLSAVVLTLAVLGAVLLPAARAGAMSPTSALHFE